MRGFETTHEPKFGLILAFSLRTWLVNFFRKTLEKWLVASSSLYGWRYGVVVHEDLLRWSTLVRESDTEVYEQTVEWSDFFNAVAVTKSDIEDLNSKEDQYFYQVFLTPKDIAAIIEILANRGVEEMPDEVEAALKTSTVALLRLALCAQGYMSETSEQPEDAS